MNLSMFKEKTFLELSNNIAENLELYRAGDFQEIISEKGLIPIEGLDVDLKSLSQLKFEHSDSDELYIEEVRCSMVVYKAFEKLSLYLARDKRLWAFLTHTVLLDYSRARWPIPEDNEEAVRFIKTHFFGAGQRDLERDNAASRLWWMAKLCSNVEGLSLKDALTALLYRSDVRANLIERPTTALNANVFSTVIEQLSESFKNDKTLFERKKFRLLMKSLNIQGGRRLLEIADKNQICKVIDLTV
ncbi:DUF6339 family protein [Thiomicrorhabdus sp.]|uniref:DUF6339 family protein n=1 Tax=Thiomicrorhabdus sp. TaxID=2039724 RepID=UPI0029C6A49F|nr:DUF6339 family protein [Thiomicrorhabdus sp.]